MYKSKAGLIAALDLGTQNVKLAVVDRGFISQSEESLHVVSAAEAESRGVRKGIVINIDFTVEAIRQCLKQAEEMLGGKIQEVVLAVSGAHLLGNNSHGVTAIKYREVSQADLDRVIEAASAVAIPFDREVVHILAQDYAIDGQSGIKDPLGISGVRLESTVHMITGSTSTVQNFIKCANRAGLTVADLVTSNLASAYGVTSHDEREQGVCVIDIGAGTSDLAIYYNSSMRHSAVLPLGGSHITNDLAAGLRTSIKSAEKIKCVHGIACYDAHGSEQRIEITALGNQGSKIVSKGEVTDIIQPRVEEIFNLLNAEIGIVLTGGTANLMGITVLAEKIFRLPVRIGTPHSLSGLSDFVKDTQSATVMGLIAYAVFGEKVNVGKLNSISVWRRTYRSVANWVQEHF